MSLFTQAENVGFQVKNGEGYPVDIPVVGPSALTRSRMNSARASTKSK